MSRQADWATSALTAATAFMFGTLQDVGFSTGQLVVVKVSVEVPGA